MAGKDTDPTERDATLFPPPELNRPMGSKRDGSKPGEMQPHIADADKAARTGSKDEEVRNTPPAGEWNEDA
jgi:hypothetical protein